MSKRLATKQVNRRKGATKHSGHMRTRRSLDRQLASLVSSDLIRLFQQVPDLAYVFRHALVQDAAYDSLLKTDRKRLHQAAAEAVERLYPDRVEQNAPLLALHYVEAGDDEKA